MTKNIVNKSIVESVKTKLKEVGANNKIHEDINSIRQALDILLVEDLSFAETNEPQMETPQQKPIKPQMPAPIQNNPISNNSGKINDIINKMRNMALEGVRELANNSNSEEYIFFKKLWDMCDKVQEAKKQEQKPVTN